MVDFLEDIYRHSKTIFNIKLAIQQAHYGYNANIQDIWDDISPNLIDLLEITHNKDSKLANSLSSELSKAVAYTTNGTDDYISFADTLENLIPDFYKAISLFGQIDESSDKYIYKSSKIGFLSLTDIKEQKRLNSSIDPMWEAYEHAQKIYNPTMMSYHFIEIDLGYLPYQIFILSNCSIDIYIYSLSQDSIDNAIDFGVLSWIPESKLHIIVNNDPIELLSTLVSARDSNEDGYYFHPLAASLFPGNFSVLIRNSYIEHMNHYYFEALKISNAYRNMKNVPKWLNSFTPKHLCSEWAILAGGPSLDSQVDYIKEHRNQFTLLCVSTILNKILNLGIEPDCVITFDSQNRTYNHFKDLPFSTVPLLLGINGNWQFGEYYSGPKYLVPCLSSPEITNILKSSNLEIFDPGSTVSTLALKIAIYFKAQQIRLFGFDLSYPNHKSHALGTVDFKEVSYEGMHLIPSVSGENVYTTPTFHYYLDEISELIKNTPNVTFINHSDIGADIPGTLWYRNE